MHAPLVAVLVLLSTSPAAAFTRSGVVHQFVHEWATENGPIPLGPDVIALQHGHHQQPVAADPRLLPGATLRIRGTLDATGTLVPEAGDRGVKVLQVPPRTLAGTTERLLVLPVDGPDFPHQGMFDPTAFATLAAGVAQQSYGHTRLTTDVRGWKRNPSPLGAALLCDFSAVVARAIALHAATVDFRAYTLLQVILPDSTYTGFLGLCSTAAGAWVGRVQLSTPDGTLPYGVIVTGEGFGADAHELGHALGLHHANSLECGTVALPADPSAACTNREYGDRFDVMGQALGEYNALYKRQLGWLGGTRPEQMLTVVPTGMRLVWSGTLTALEVAAPAGTTTPKALLLPRLSTPPTWLTVEARFVTGRDRFYPDDWLDGVMLHTALFPFALRNPNDARLYPVDADQAHLVWPHAAATHTGTEAALRVGESFDDWPWRISVDARDPQAHTCAVTVEDLRIAPATLCQALSVPCPPDAVTGEVGVCKHGGCCYHSPGHVCQLG